MRRCYSINVVNHLEDGVLLLFKSMRNYLKAKENLLQKGYSLGEIERYERPSELSKDKGSYLKAESSSKEWGFAWLQGVLRKGVGDIIKRERYSDDRGLISRHQKRSFLFLSSSSPPFWSRCEWILQ